MSASSVSFLARAATATITLGVVATALGPATAADGQAARRYPANPTGVAAGSAPNGAGNLKVSLSVAPGNRIKVSWVRPAPASKLKRYTIRVGINRSLNAAVRTYKVGRSKQGTIVAPAQGATTSSGNYSFVKVTVVRKDGRQGSSPAKWIQAPISARCTASPEHQVRVATFNVRTWGVAPAGPGPAYTWAERGPHVVDQILSSDAHVIAIQEASGHPGSGFGGTLRQNQWLLNRLNADDTDPSHDWRDAVGDDPYRTGGGLVGTRVFYDATKFQVLTSGLKRVSGRDGVGDSLLPWARMQARSTDAIPFVFAGTHLRTGDTLKAYNARVEQMKTVIPFLKDKQQGYGGQVIFGGDLNSTINTKPNNRVQLDLLGAGFYDSFATPALVNPQYGTTYSGFPLRPSPSRRDYLMTLGPVKGSCSYTNRVYNSVSQVASDHFMQVATLPLAVD